MQTLCTFPRAIICAKMVDNANFGRYNQFVIEKLQKRAIRPAALPAGSGMGCKAPREGHCEACAMQDKSDTRPYCPWLKPVPEPRKA